MTRPGPSTPLICLLLLLPLLCLLPLSTLADGTTPSPTTTTISSSPSPAADNNSNLRRANPRAAAQPAPGVGDGADRCAFYCFFVPRTNEKINVSHYKNLTGCSHLVYGFAEIGETNEIEHATSYDYIPDDYFGNYKQITNFRYRANNPMFMLYGVQVLNTSTFLPEGEDKLREVADEMVWWARHSRFQGIFLDVDVKLMSSPDFPRWMTALNESMNADGQVFHNRLTLVLAISAGYVPQFYARASNYLSMVETFYLTMDEVVSSPKKALLLDPLYPSETVSETDTIKWVAEKFASQGVPRHRIVVGLSAWARSYVLPVGAKGGHGVPALKLGPGGNWTERPDGRLAFYELCKVRGYEEALEADSHYDSATCSNSFGDNQTDYWYSFTAPEHVSLDRKLKWISFHGYGGVGLDSVQADDVNGTCGGGRLPLHNSVYDLFQCTKHSGGGGSRGPSTSGGARCTRMCQLNWDQKELKFDFSRLQSDWCSHLVISQADVNLRPDVVATEAMRRAVIDYNSWAVDPKPYLILAIGDSQPAETWKQVVHTENSRKALADKVRQVVQDYNADGVIISWTKTPTTLGYEAGYFSSFLLHLREVLGRNSQIHVAVSHTGLNAHFYNMTILNSTAVDYVIAQGYRFYSHNRHFTGHHSPTFGSPTINDGSYTMKGMIDYMKGKGLRSKKIIAGFSAEGMSMFFENPHLRIERTIGDKTDPSKYNFKAHASAPGTISQSEICEIIANKTAKRVFIEDLGVPYLVNGAEFIAYDDVQSMQIKAVWGSLQDLGGLSLHGLEMDNPEALCPAGKPFPMLRTIVNTQICDACGSRPVRNTTFLNSTTLSSRPHCYQAFTVSCNYKLPDSNDDDPMQPNDIPFQQCDEIVVEEAVLDARGELNYPDGQATDHLRELRKISNRPTGRRLVLAIRCQYMSPAQFDTVIGQRSALRDRILRHVSNNGYSGVEFRCNHLLRGQATKKHFSGFVEEIKNTFETEGIEQVDQCPRTVGVRVPVWERDLSRNYDINILRRLDRVVLETFQVTSSSSNHTQLLSPLFFVETSQGVEQHSINDTLAAWTSGGLGVENIMVQLPSYGILQQIVSTNTTDESPNEATTAATSGSKTIERAANYIILDVLPMKKICEKTKATGSSTNVMYAELVAVGTTKDYKEWMSFETDETITYKMKYIVSKGLAGVSIKTINEDDRKGACTKGRFPVLTKVLNNKCTIPLPGQDADNFQHVPFNFH